MRVKNMSAVKKSRTSRRRACIIRGEKDVMNTEEYGDNLQKICILRLDQIAFLRENLAYCRFERPSLYTVSFIAPLMHQ